MATLKTLQKIVQENALDDEKKRPELKFNPGLALIGLRTTGPMALIYFWCLKGGRLFGTGRFFEKQPNVQKTLIFISKRTIFETGAVTNTHKNEC